MEMLWYYVRGGQTFGPIPFAELKKLAATGKLQPADSVRMDGTADWQPASSVPDLCPAVPAPKAAEPIPVSDLPPGEPLPILELDEPVDFGKDKPKDDRGRRDDDRDRERGDRERDRDDDRGRDRNRRRDRDDDDYDRGDRRRREENTDDLKQVAARAFSSDLQAIKLTVDEQRELKRAGILTPTLQRYAAWRRGMLYVVVVPGFLAALFSLIGSFSTEGLSQFGVFLAFLNAVAVFALPVTALIAAVNYSRVRMSHRVILLGGAIAYLTPIVSAIIPFSWLESSSSATGSAAGLGGLIVKILLGVSFAALAVLAGLTRACVRTKGLVPMALVPGWVLIFSAPLLVLVGFAAFFMVYQTASNLLLILGMLLWLGSPLIYLWRTDLLTRPVTRPKESAALGQLQLYSFISSAVGILLIVIFLFAAKLPGSGSIVGFDKSSSLIRAWDIRLHAVWLDYLGRSLFLTVLFADLLMAVTLSFSKQTKEFALSEHAAEFDKDMNELATVIMPPVRKRHDEDDDSRRDRERDRDRRERDEYRSSARDPDRDDRDRDRDRDRDDRR